MNNSQRKIHYAIIRKTIFTLLLLFSLFISSCSKYYPEGQIYKRYHPNYDAILLKAVENSNYEMTIFALNNGADIHYRHPADGDSIIGQALSSDSKGIQDIFLGKGEHPNLKLKISMDDIKIIENIKNVEFPKVNKTYKQKPSPIIKLDENSTLEEKIEFLYGAIKKNELDAIKALIDKDKIDVNKAYNDHQPLFFFACAYGTCESIEYFLKNGARPNLRTSMEDYNGKPRYMSAFGKVFWYNENDKYEIIKMLLDYGADVDIRFDTEVYYNITLLMLACDNNDYKLADLLLKNGADINAVDENNNNVLNYALQRNENKSYKMTKYCLDNGANVNNPITNESKAYTFALGYGNKTTIELYNKHNAHFSTDKNILLEIGMIAAETGNVILLKKAIKNGLDVNTELYEKTMLYKASLMGHDNTVKYLLDNGARPSVKNGHWGIDPLIVAVYMGYNGVIELLLTAQPDIINAKRNEQLLHLAIEKSNEKVVKTLLDNDYNIEEKDSFGNSPLYEATYNGNIDMVRLLLAYNADVNNPNNNGFTPLFATIGKKNSFEITKLLIENGANVNHVTKYGHPPLFKAASIKNRKEIIKLLVKKGADVNFKGEDGETSIFHTLLFSNIENARTLIENGADLKVLDNEGKSVLHTAQLISTPQMIELLVENGAE